MRQKKINDILYVFDITPYEITEDTDANVIKVQEESYAGFIALNESLANKIVKFNYHIMTVTKQEWADYINADEPVEPDEPGPQGETGYSFTLDGYGVHTFMNVQFDGIQQEMKVTWHNVLPNTIISLVPTMELKYYQTDDSNLEWDEANHCWVTTMPEEDLTVTINYIG